jgi:polar amino acid transport system permease protein
MRNLTALDLVFLALTVRWTILLSVFAFVGGSVLGLVMALMRVAPARWVRWSAIGYIRLFQSTPVLMQLFTVYFCIPLLGLSIDPYTAAILALSLNSAAFLGDIWRGCIQSVPKGQWEAARALGLHYPACMAKVVLPQALRSAIAPTVGFTVNLVKSTSVASIIGFVELTRSGALLNNAVFEPFIIFGTVALIYFVLCWPISLASRRLEARLGRAYQS